MISSKTFLWLRLSTFVVLACIVTQIASAQVFDPPVLLSTEPFSSNEIDQDSPALMVRGDTVYVVWSEFRLNGDPPPDPAGMYATLARWNVGGNPSANIIGLLPPDTLPTEPGIVGRMFLRGSYDGYSTDSLLVRGIVTTQADRFDNGSGPDTLYRTQLMLHFAEPDGWRKVKIAEMRSTEKSVELDTRGYGFWENFLVAWQVQGEPTGTVTALDRSGDVAWSVQNIPMPGTGTMTILPYHTDEFLLINGNTGIFYNGSEPIGTLTFTSSGTHTQYLRLDHDHFVRGHFSETTQRYRLERYDFQGNLSESVESNIDDPDADYTMTLIHSFDPVVAFVSAGPAGVWGNISRGILSSGGSASRFRSIRITVMSCRLRRLSAAARPGAEGVIPIHCISRGSRIAEPAAISMVRGGVRRS